MPTVTVSELQRKIGEVQDLALAEPVSITRNGREKYVLLNIQEYNRLKRRDRQALSIEELSEKNIRDIAAAKVPEEYQYLNQLLKD